MINKSYRYVNGNNYSHRKETTGLKIILPAIHMLTSYKITCMLLLTSPGSLALDEPVNDTKSGAKNSTSPKVIMKII